MSGAGTRVSVVVVDDNPILRMGVRSLLESEGTVDVVGEAGDGAAGAEVVEATRPDVVLLDVRMPGTGGLEVVGRMAAVSRVVMLTSSEEQGTVREAVASGAVGYLVHGEFGAHDLAAAVRAVASGGTLLSPSAMGAVLGASSPAAPAPSAAAALLSARQVEIMDQVAQGLSNREIAKASFVTEKTVKNHVNHIFARLGARTRAEAVALWLRPDEGGSSRRP